MNKFLIILFIVYVASAIWITIEMIKSIKRWIKKEREEILKDE